MATDRTNQPVVGVHIASNNTAIAHTPAYLVDNPTGLATEGNSTPNAGLSVFANPVTGNVDIGVTHTGDLGGAA
jgi:hypothetical protein